MYVTGNFLKGILLPAVTKFINSISKHSFIMQVIIWLPKQFYCSFMSSESRSSYPKAAL